jgi:hypothetical protein
MLLLFRECAEKAMHRMNGKKFGDKEVSICWGSDTPCKQVRNCTMMLS